MWRCRAQGKIDKRRKYPHHARSPIFLRARPASAASGVSKLANSNQARKRARQAQTHRDHNATLRSKVRTSIKKVDKSIAAGDAEAAANAYKEAVPVIDGMANKGIIHKNKAARHKSRLNARVRAMSA
jgi:small subunit ribosomal protein S20